MNKTLLFVTGNEKKFLEVQALIPGVKSLAIDLPEIQELNSRKIIEAKVRAAFAYCDGPLIVDDTSLYIDCFKGHNQLSGLPGPFIKWFLRTMKNSGIADMVERSGEYGAQACTLIGYATSPDNILFFEGSVHGTIVKPPHESSCLGTTGWDPIFQPVGYDKTFGQMDFATKNDISPRSQAVKKLKAFLDGNSTQ